MGAYLSGARSGARGDIESGVCHDERIRVGDEDADLKSNHKVFLSHSGAQKGFTEHLCIKLEGCFRFPFFDKRWESLPIGENFPSHIFAAIKQCDVGVVILSEEFLTSKWPMMELVAMVDRANLTDSGSFIIMPIFLRTSVQELKDPKNRSRWESHWRKLAKKNPSRIEFNKWRDALNYLHPVNGLEYDGKSSEVKFQNEIIDAICRIVPAGLKLEDSYIQGRSRLCEVIQDKIKVLQNSESNEVCVLGLYGVGGIGKTSICKALCNEYFTKFHGRVCLAELEKGSNEETLLREVVQCLSDTSAERLKELHAYQVREGLTKGSFIKEAVFLALDNLLDTNSSMEHVKRYLSASLPSGSIVMVTARSKDLLLKLMQYISESNCIEMPELNMEEAKALFVKSCGFENDGEVNEHVERCVVRCCFRKDNTYRYEDDPFGMYRDYSYPYHMDIRGDHYERYYERISRTGDFHFHPLALQVLGTQLGGISRHKWQAQLRLIDEEIFNLSREQNHPIFSILRKSFDMLPEEDQFLFIDAALFLPDPVEGSCSVFEWLGMVHGIPHIDDVKSRLENLKKKSLLESLGDGTKARIGMHDLWRSFCVAETKRGEIGRRRWAYVALKSSHGDHFYTTPTHIWKRVERIAFIGVTHSKFAPRHYFAPSSEALLAGANFAHFPNVSVLKATHLCMDRSVAFDLPSLTNLRSLEVCASNLAMLAPTGLPRGLVFLSLEWYGLYELEPEFSRRLLGEIECLKELKCLQMIRYGGHQLPNMSNMASLSRAMFHGCTNVTTLSGLGPNLRLLDLRSCSAIQTCPGVDDLVALEELNCRGCHKLKELPDLRKLMNLHKLDLSECYSLNELPGVEGAVALVKLHAGLPDVPYYSTLARRSDSFTLPDMRKLSDLQVLHIGKRRLEAIPGFDSLLSLRKLVADFRYVADMPSLRQLTKLQKLKIDGSCLEGLGELKKLHSLDIGFCRGLPGLDLSSLVNLQSVRIADCEFNHVDGLSALENLRIEKCAKLESVRGFSSLPRLKLLEIQACPLFTGWNTDSATGLQTLTPWSENQQVIFSRLETLECWEVGILNLPDLITMPLLRNLTLWQCKSLETITSSEPHHTLSYVLICNCVKMLTLPDLGTTFPGLVELALGKVLSLRCSKPLTRLQRLARMPENSFQPEPAATSTLPDLGVYFPALTKLELGGVVGLSALRSSVPLRTLQVLELTKCKELEELPDLMMFPALQSLDLLDCVHLLTLHSSAPLPALRSLNVRGTSLTPNDSLRAFCHPACVIRQGPSDLW